jgi:hypothetical protein
MPDFLRPAVYPVLLTCIVGSLWMLAGSVASDNDQRAFADPIKLAPTHHSNAGIIGAGNDQYAELDQN